MLLVFQVNIFQFIIVIYKTDESLKANFDILDFLIGAMKNEDLNISISCLITIGYIFQEMNPGLIKLEQIQNCLKNLIDLIQNKDNRDLIYFSLETLNEFLPYIQKHFNDEVIIYITNIVSN